MKRRERVLTGSQRARLLRILAAGALLAQVGHARLGVLHELCTPLTRWVMGDVLGRDLPLPETCQHQSDCDRGLTYLGNFLALLHRGVGNSPSLGRYS